MNGSVFSFLFRGFPSSRPLPHILPALPVRARGRWIALRVTRPGFVFLGMLLILLFGSINHGNNLGFLLTFLLGSMAFVSLFHTLRNVSGVSPAAVRAEPVFAGQNAVFAVALQPVSRSRPSLSLHFPGGEPVEAHLEAGSRQTVNVSHPAAKRGMLTPPVLLVSTTYPLGLFRAAARLPVEASCLVYPRPLDGPLVPARARAEEGYSAGENDGPGVEDFVGLEAYQRGDPLQHISWKALSRGQGLHTKKFEGQLGRIIYFDPDVLTGDDPEQKLSRVCAMVLKAEALGLAYGLRIGERLIEPGQGGAHKHQCLQELALAWT
ncbi:MAG: DUF58 domain-containing protein [Desulfobulbaceae bacterium]|jgi:uncharacterized protein (DUF58 family)|nr:DUF58 domain-containing protein [Desulfobulbaceae bacterium]